MMVLTGQAKINYQREYMRRYRANKGKEAYPGPKVVSQNAPECPVLDELKAVRPIVSLVRPKTGLVRPKGLSENQWAYVQMKANK